MNLVTLSNDVLLKLLRRPEVVAEFPFMQAAASRVQTNKPRCAPCQKRKQNAVQLEGVKTAIGGLSPEQKARLKGFLGADQVRLYYNNTRGQTVRQTF